MTTFHVYGTTIDGDPLWIAYSVTDGIVRPSHVASEDEAGARAYCRLLESEITVVDRDDARVMIEDYCRVDDCRGHAFREVLPDQLVVIGHQILAARRARN